MFLAVRWLTGLRLSAVTRFGDFSSAEAGRVRWSLQFQYAVTEIRSQPVMEGCRLSFSAGGTNRGILLQRFNIQPMNSSSSPTNNSSSDTPSHPRPGLLITEYFDWNVQMSKQYFRLHWNYSTHVTYVMFLFVSFHSSIIRTMILRL